MDLRESNSVHGQRHPWEQARFRFFSRILERSGALSRARTIFDVGSGDAWFASELSLLVPKETNLVCWDTGYEALAGGPTGDRGERLKFVSERPTERADLLLLLDVLEHVEDAADFLGTLVRENVSPGGVVLMSVPAWPLLFSEHDVFLKHHRRYSPRAALTLLREAGLSVRESGGLFHSLLAPRAISLGMERARQFLRRDTTHSPQAEWRGGPRVTRALTSLLTLEGHASELLASMKIDAPGLSFWALSGKP